MWCTAPWLLFQLLRNFVSALERPRIVLWLSIVGIALNALLSWALIFGHFGLARARPGRRRPRQHLDLAGHVRRADRGRSSRDRQFRRFHLFGRWWRFDRQRTLAMVRLGWPIGLTMALEMGVFALAAYFMGWIGAAAVAAHAVALQIAALTFMVPLGLGQAATVRVGLALGRGDQPAITRAGWTAWVLGVGFMGAMALGMWAIPRPLVDPVPRPTCRPMPRSSRLAVSFLQVAAAFQLVDGAQVIGAGMLRGLHDTRWPLISPCSAIGSSASASAPGWPSPRLAGRRHLDRPRRGLAVVAVLMLARWLLRDGSA